MIKNWWNYATSLYNAKGRATRKEMWTALGVQITYLAAMVAVFVPFVLARNEFNVELTIIFGVLSLIIGLPALFMLIMIGLGTYWLVVRRMHDHGYSGWVWFVPAIVGTICDFVDRQAYELTMFGVISIVISLGLFIFAYCIPGEKDNNEYGDSPYNV